MSQPIVAVADLHGHLKLFDALVAHLDHLFGEAYTLVTLGDYVDNGPEIPALLDRLIELRAQRQGRFVAIMGNHDLACVRSMGWNGGPPDESWCRRWARNYSSYDGSTARAYGVGTGQELARAMPPAHREFLQSLPWYHEIDPYVFVHAGLKSEPLRPQLDVLARREPLEGTYLHDQIRDKSLAHVSDPAWGRVVVSGHTHKPYLRAPGQDHPAAPHFVTDHRITVSSDADHTGHLWAVVLPRRQFLRVEPSGEVTSPLDR